MFCRTLIFGGCFAALLIGGAGCASKIKPLDETYTLKAGDIRTLSVDAPKQDQIVKIEVSATHPIDVVVQLTSEKSKSLISKRMKDDSVEVKIPANQAFQIILSSVLDCKATIKVNSL